MSKNYYEIEFAKKTELEDNFLIHTPDRLFTCIIAEHYPSYNEVETFCKEDMETSGYDTICDIKELSYDEAHELYYMKDEYKFPILK